jgi:hypothetical protein
VKRAILLVMLGLAGNCVMAADQLACHYTYGGETHTLKSRAQPSSYGIAPQAIGSYLLFRPVFESQPRKLAAVKLYTYVDHPDGPVLIHQASYAYPAATHSHGPYGFTGLQQVYEPVRDSELSYWCEITR